MVQILFYSETYKDFTHNCLFNLVLLRSRPRERRKPCIDAFNRRAVPQNAVLWLSSHGNLDLQGHTVNDKRVRHLMRLMGLEAIYQKPRTSIPNKEHIIYPYLLRNILIERVNHVWSTDITYVPMERGFLYLVAVMDWYSRARCSGYVLSWRLSNTMDVSLCIEALNEALERHGKPEIFNSDQGSQFTSPQFTSI
jgi:putative transposase